jgi:hypothetical protein
MRIPASFAWAGAVSLLLAGCAGKPALKSATEPPPIIGNAEVEKFFAALPQGRLDLALETPGRSYAKDPAEKDVVGILDSNGLKFDRLSIALSPVKQKGKALVEMTYRDPEGNQLVVHGVDLLDLVPVVGQRGGLQYAEYLLKEFERFGIVFYRKEHVVSWTPGPRINPATAIAMERMYQAAVFNNCLDAGKWELVVNSRYYEKFDTTQAKVKQAQRFRILAHSWFALDPGLYRVLVKAKNPGLQIDPYTSYDSLTKSAEAVVIPFDRLGRVKRQLATRVLELGYRSKRELFELDEEEMYKDWYDLVLNRDRFHTYADVLETPVILAKFADQGFYRPDKPQSFDFGWMKNLDQIEMGLVEAAGPERFAQIRIWGENSPYQIVLGNFDLGRLNPSKPAALQFGINPFPKQRLQRKTPFGTGYNLGPKGKEIQPYLLIADRKTGKWVNNQKLGLEQAFIGWQSIEKTALMIHLVTYERMIPVWMARLGIEESERSRGLIANATFNPSDKKNYPDPEPTAARKQREALRARYAGLTPVSDTVVLDFEDLAHDDGKLAAHGYYHDEKGFTLLAGGFLSGQPFRSVGKKGFPFTGSTSLINGDADGINYLMKRDEVNQEILDPDDNLFSLISLDLSRFNSAKADKIAFVGVRRDSSTFVQEVALGPGYGPTKVIFGPDFREVATVRWVSQSTQVDNITLRRGAKRRYDLAKAERPGN